MPEEATAAEPRPRPRSRRAEEMARDYKKALAERKPTPEERRTLAKRYVGILAAFAADHPSVQVTEALAAGVPHAARLPRGDARAAPGDQGEDRRATSTRRARSRSTSSPSIR